MSSLRKLQTEIEKTFKKVQEGLEVFDDLHEQYYATDTANAKEKLEVQLKTEIKKLQKHREQIKTWATASEIKDKTDLLNARKEIERRMERFKVCEKEAKTKTFSKEGLGRSNQDPKEKAKGEMREWLSSVVDSINTQVEEFEGELEGMAGQKSGKKGKAPPRAVHLEESVARHRTHVLRLEQMLRLLDNDALAPEQVDGVRDLVDDYLDRNQSDWDEFATPDDLYGELLEQLDGLSESVVAAPPSHAKPTRNDKEAKLEREREERERERQKAAAAAVKAQLAAQGNSRLAVETAQEQEEAAKKGPAPPAPAAAPAPPSRTNSSSGGSGASVAAAAPAAVALVPPPPPPPPVQPPPPPPPPARPSSSPRTSAPTEPASPSAAATLAQQQEAAASQSDPGTPVRAGAQGLVGPPLAAADAQAVPPPPAIPRPAMPQSPQAFNPADANAFPTLGAAQLQANGLRPAGPSAAAVVASGLPKRPVGPPPAASNLAAASRLSVDGSEDGGPPGDTGVDSLAAALLQMGLQDSGPTMTPAQSLQLLSACAARSIPQPGDTLWQTVPQRPRPPPVPIPASYPAQRLPIFDAPALYEKLDAETLFFIFYHQPGSHQQYLAARELKRQAWRFHKQLGAWFQRHEEPKAGGQPGDDWETGSYVYFDAMLHDDMAGSGWCYRLKQDFHFQYGQLEDELTA